MKILLIGGTRFIGMNVASQLAERKHTVTLYHRQLLESLPYQQIAGDRSDVKALQSAIAQVQPDCIIHMIAMESEHIKVLEEALAGNPTRVVVVSSADVYKAFEVLNRLSEAEIQPLPLAETSPLRDIRYPYRGKEGMPAYENYEKIDVETLALASPVIQPIITRLGMVFGVNDPNKRFDAAIITMKNNKKMEVPSDLAVWQSCYSSVINTAYGIVLATEKGRVGEVYNIADKEVFTQLEWYQKIAKLLAWQGEFVITGDTIGAGNYFQSLTLDSNKIRKDLGYKEKITGDDQLKAILTLF
ncbi:MAG: NAD-dependent epimerase/dehydratase family protein [Erysipelotrichaceae bacterium]|jgi:nucleoside-diphosphate-sugar epimerase|nr:NAD-dependent epimerase/dehydratase family protein [Erysipelotrichaceae bacterium]